MHPEWGGVENARGNAGAYVTARRVWCGVGDGEGGNAALDTDIAVCSPDAQLPHFRLQVTTRDYVNADSANRFLPTTLGMGLVMVRSGGGGRGC